MRQHGIGIQNMIGRWKQARIFIYSNKIINNVLNVKVSARKGKSLKINQVGKFSVLKENKLLSNL